MNFDKANHSFHELFCLGGNRFSKKSFWSFELGTWIGVKMNEFNAFSWNVNIINQNIFPTLGGIYKLEKLEKAFDRGIKP